MAAKNLMDLTGRVAVVIGGTSGLGRELAIGLATAGADVVPTGRREAMVEEVCADVEHAGGRTLRAFATSVRGHRWTSFATPSWRSSARWTSC